MNSLNTFSGELVDNVEDFFAPTPSDMFDSLLGQYNVLRGNINKIADEVLESPFSIVFDYFVDGNLKDEQLRGIRIVSEVFKKEAAIAELNADFWSRTLKMTDVYDYMPQKRREEWSEQIRNPMGIKEYSGHDKESTWKVEPLPEFTEDIVRPTIISLLSMRMQFFSERVDGIFRSLSNDHVTNIPQGFGKRMIINGMGYNSFNVTGYVNDLRAVIAKFMGRDDPKWRDTDIAINRTPSDGKWYYMDGGSIKLRRYLKGTIHLEVHPDMVWRLNQILSYLHPNAIPAEFRTKRPKKQKEYKLYDRPLPFGVLNILYACDTINTRPIYSRRHGTTVQPLTTNPHSYKLDDYNVDKHNFAEAEKVLGILGGVKLRKDNNTWWEFDYHVKPILDEICVSGCIPDHKAYQFYPTPDNLAQMAVDMADINETHCVLEPSAGMGAIASLLPKENTTCVEVSEFHSKILESKGFKSICVDFLEYADRTTERYDRIVMNPPFSDGRWQAHISEASKILNNDGILVGIVPSSAKGKDILPGFDIQWSDVLSNEFAGTSISVVMFKATVKQ